MNTKIIGKFPVQIIEMHSHTLIDDYPIPGSDNDPGSYLHCNACNDFLGWATNGEKYIIIKNRIE